MSGISQTIPNYHGGISEQPDYIKSLGTVKDAVNVIPDLTYGLYKRPGSKRIASISPNSGDDFWFHYFRDKTEGAYIGQVSNGAVKMWRCDTGAECSVTHDSGIEDYLASGNEDLTFTTIYDTTFVANSAVTTDLKSDTVAAMNEQHYAYVELKKTENGRQYALDISDKWSSDQSYTTAVRLSVERTGPSSADPGSGGKGHCPHIGTKVFYETGDLVFRLTTTGQQTVTNNSGAEINDHGDYSCTYTHKIDLLHGGMNPDSTESITLEGATYTVTVDATETYSAPAKSGNHLIRPKPTPFDADTAVSASSVLGGIKTAVQAASGMSCKIIGNGLFIYSANEFNIKVVEPDLMRVITNETSDITNLPTQCKHGYQLKVVNSQSAEDDYYLEFHAYNDADGPGRWVETMKSGIKYKINEDNMPVTIKRTGVNAFQVSKFTWNERAVGDDGTNPKPSFIDNSIQKVVFFRNRLGLVTNDSVCFSRPGSLSNFWAETAISTGPNDPVDIKSSSKYPSKIKHAIEANGNLILFSANEQFLLGTDSTSFQRDTATISTLSTYYLNDDIEPISLGNTLGFVDNSGSKSKFFEIAQAQQAVEPIIIDQSKVIPNLLPKDLNIMANSRENSIVFLGKSGTDTIYGYRYYQQANQRLQSAWFKWKFGKTIKHFFVIDDTFYLVDDNNFFQKIHLIQSDQDISLTQDGENFLVHLDNWTTITGGNYNAGTNKTTFTGVTAQTGVTSKFVIIDSTGHYAECTVDGTTVTVPDDWTSGTRYVGHLYDMQVDLPKFYPQKNVGNKTVADISGSLVLHRVNIGFGSLGVYESTLNRVGKTAYTRLYESAEPNDYEEGDIPYLTEAIETIPVYDKNTNVSLTLKSTHPSPATLRSLSWEGDYTTKNYRRG